MAYEKEEHLVVLSCSNKAHKGQKEQEDPASYNATDDADVRHHARGATISRDSY